MVEATRPRWKKKRNLLQRRARERAWCACAGKRACVERELGGGGACAGEWACVMRVRSTFHVRKRVGGRGARASMACVCWRVGRLVHGGGGGGGGGGAGPGGGGWGAPPPPPVFPAAPPPPTAPVVRGRGRGRELFPSHPSPPMFPGLPPHPHTHSGPAMLPLVTHLETSSKFLAKCLLCLDGKPWPSVTDAISPPPPCLPSVPVISMSITSHHFKSH